MKYFENDREKPLLDLCKYSCDCGRPQVCAGDIKGALLFPIETITNSHKTTIQQMGDVASCNNKYTEKHIVQR